MKSRCALLLAVFLLNGCGDSRQEGGGGFETPDLQARVVTPLGKPAAGARVWLVRSMGDTAPAEVVDSVLTDANGLARFQGQPASHANFGIDARSDALLAMAPRSLALADSTRIFLVQTGTVSVPTDSVGLTPRLFVAGSHFGSQLSADGTKAVLQVPRGTWDVAVKIGSKTTVWRAVAVDSSPIALPRDSLATSPDILADSFSVDGTIMFADTSLPQPWGWTKLDSVLLRPPYYASVLHCRSFLVADDTGATTLQTSTDTGGAVRSIDLADSGTIALSFRFGATDPIADSGLGRILALVDSARNGAWLELDRRSATPTSDSVLVMSAGNGVSDSIRTNSLPGNQLSAATWYFTWKSGAIVVRNSNGVVGRVNIATAHGRFHFEITAEPIPQFQNGNLTYTPEKTQISRLRYYRP